MEFALITIVSLAVLAVIAALASHFDRSDDTIVEAKGCASCTGRDDCKLACAIDQKRNEGMKK